MNTPLTDIIANQTIAFFAAHPDDIEVMLGYAVLASIKESKKVYAFIATDGEASTLGDPAFVQSRKRRNEAVNGLGRLGIVTANIFLPGLPDGGLHEASAFTQLTQSIESFIDEYHITLA